MSQASADNDTAEVVANRVMAVTHRVPWLAAGDWRDGVVSWDAERNEAVEGGDVDLEGGDGK